MQNSRTIKILKSLSKNEIIQLGDFIYSPFPKLKISSSHKHSSFKKVIELFEILKKEYPDFSAENIKKEIIFQKLFPLEKYNDSRLRSLRHDSIKNH